MADPVGEDGWLALVDEASRTAGDLDQRVGVVELYKRAIGAEPWSLKLWLAYCEWVWSLYTDCQTGDAGWPEEEQLLGQDLFAIDTALKVWQQGAQATQYRLNDSHELWNRWISIELEELAESPTPEKIEHIRNLFFERLQTPHSTWDDTAQMFSSFLTRYDEPSWESTMVQTTKLAKRAKQWYKLREDYELKLRLVFESGDILAKKVSMQSYLAWEVAQAGKRNNKGIRTSPSILCVALFERALSSTLLGLEPSTWEDYMDFVASVRDEGPEPHIPSLLSVVQRATSHCPWSGPLWARYIEIAESENLNFEIMEQIKHAATNTNRLDRDGMDGVVEFFVAWAGYLKRRTAVEGATDEDIDVAEMGLPTALESVQDWGQRVYGKKDYKGDPQFRIESIIIQHLTSKGSFEEARQVWKKLISTHADSYDFWQQYYFWEMLVPHSPSSPSLPTAILRQAVQRETLDWPERMMEVYIRHCVNYEDVETLLLARRTIRSVEKKVAERRQREAAEAAIIYAQQQGGVPVAVGDSPSGQPKRKREETSEDPEVSSTKKAKKIEQGVDQEALREQHLKRDRENTTIIVSNLPLDVTQTKVKQYFKDYGHINSLTVKSEADGLSSTALVEFQSPEDVQSALLRDQKYFTDKQIQVQAGTGLTLYVTNFPPSADDGYLRDLFKDCGEIFSIRWPSLKHNTHRRFCYVSFRTKEAAALATQLHGKKLEGFYKLVAQYSDPSNKKSREGALAEGREIHITSLDKSLTEDDLQEVFKQYGKVERTRILRTRSGESTGAAFIAFEKKEEAEAALAMDKTKLKASVLKVEMSVHKNFKPTARSLGKASSASPGPDADGDSAMSPSPAPEHQSANTHAQQAGGASHSSDRTITLMNVPDTVNDARIRVLAEPYGEIVKLALRPDHQGAIIEFTNVAAAGRAALGLGNHEIVPGRKLRTGGLKDLFKEKDERKMDSVQAGQNKKASAAFIQPTAPVRRPGIGGRGGLGVRRGLVFAGVRSLTTAAAASGDANGVKAEESVAPKSNADFKAMFTKGGAE